ncbi:hypothetical protein BEN48_02425 [Hymenobacter glacialis]|uniref:Uncharacterized protein n=1 Tax=Hymenobacter glacialis TaxID=1908236 RepID=A0A1G1T154_9BACT|nr:hypothetical protein BEN48_02425 [Hymenobacter glacialis]
MSGSPGGLELNSLKFARWGQEQGGVPVIGLPDTPLARLAAKWAVPYQLLAVRRGLFLPLAAWGLRQLAVAAAG